MRPTEFHAATAIPFIGLFVALTIILAIFFALAKPNGELCYALDTYRLC
jgi:hypothetical protein